uniref:Uncharacterized protein n=1 Tax=Anguilla anguilla TaxID=7936 RepID=A0A0E9VQU2_ANGAN
MFLLLFKLILYHQVSDLPLER